MMAVGFAVDFGEQILDVRCGIERAIAAITEVGWRRQ